MRKKAKVSAVKKRLRVSGDKKWLGVCGGVAKYLGVDAAAVRVLFVVFVVLSGFFPGLIIYIAAAWVMSEAE